jgi:hypothetical protein
MGGKIKSNLSPIPPNPLITRFLYLSKEKNSRSRNRNEAKLKTNISNCDTKVAVAQANGIRGAGGRRRFGKLTMLIRLDTVLRKVEQMPNRVNSDPSKGVLPTYER